MRRHIAATAVLIGVSVLAGVAIVGAISPASAQERAVAVLDARDAELLEADGGGWTVDLALTNLTAGMLVLSSQPGDLRDSECRPEVAPARLLPARTVAVEVTVPQRCRLVDGAFEFEIDADLPGDVGGFSPASFRIAADLATDADAGRPAWHYLLAAATVALVLLAGVLAAVRLRGAR